MKIKDLPQPIKELALKRQVEQMGYYDENTCISLAFKWSETHEESVFWDEINSGNFSIFYDLYPQDTDTCKDKYVQSVIDNFKNRSEVGIFKYGTTLERKDLNVHDWLIHLQEELMDAVLYIERLKSEKIADDFAIGFAEWLSKKERTKFQVLSDCKKTTVWFTSKKGIGATTKELLEIYKKEQGL